MSSPSDTGARTGDDVRERINERLKEYEDINRYTAVKVLVLYWQDGDDEGFKEEAIEVREMFQSLFNYDISSFAIPSEDSHLQLDDFVNRSLSELKNMSTKGQRLLIIHYGGHGDPDTSNTEGEGNRSVWAARREGGPTLNWYEIQLKFNHASADVLLLLDCCFGAQAGRGRLNLPHRVELLAAAAMGVQTPPPGPRSFTRALIKSIKALLQNKAQVLMSQIHTSLATSEYKLAATPVYIKIRHGSSDSTILLEPFTNDEPPRQHVDDGPLIRLSVRTTEVPTSNSIDEYVKWLGSDVPNSVIGLQVEEVLQSTKQIRTVIEQTKAFHGTHEALHDSLQDEIISEWAQLKHQIEKLETRQQTLDAYTVTQRTAEIHAILRQASSIPQKLLQRVYQDVLKFAVADRQTLDSLLEHAAGLPETLQEQLRLYWTAHVSSRGMPPEATTAVSKHESTESSYLEFKTYARNSAAEDIDEAKNRVSRLAELLQANKNHGFRSFKCLKWYSEPADHRFTLAFEIPSPYRGDTWTATNLSEVIRKAVRTHRPTLDQRFTMALQIAKALQRWHQVNWVHQSVSSPNIVLFCRTTDEPADLYMRGVDYSATFLQGFDFARPNQSPSLGRAVDDPTQNVYRHPKRQGPARQGHRKVHDLYSLGVVLLEIGLWQGATEIVDLKATLRANKQLTVSAMEEKLRHAASERLPHYAGVLYKEAVLTCLTGEFSIEKDDVIESELGDAFQRLVIDKLVGPVISS